MEVSSADEKDKIVAELHEAKGLLKGCFVRRGHGERALKAEVVREGEEVEVGRVAPDAFGVGEEFAELVGLLARLDAEGRFASLDGADGVGAGADATDARSYLARFSVVSVDDEAFKIAGALFCLELAFRYGCAV